jgi:hypothetical protein
VHVVYIDFDGPVACQVGYKREKGVAVYGPTDQVFFTAKDPALLEVSVKEQTSYGVRLYLKALGRGTPVVQARLGSATGPILAEQELDEFILDTSAVQHLLVNGATDTANSIVTMSPWIPNLNINFAMYAHYSTFAGGATAYTLNTSDQTSVDINGDPAIDLSVDPTTGETQAVMHVDIEIPADESSYCFSASFDQHSRYGTEMGCAHINGTPCYLKPVPIYIAEGDLTPHVLVVNERPGTGNVTHDPGPPPPATPNPHKHTMTPWSTDDGLRFKIVAPSDTYNCLAASQWNASVELKAAAKAGNKLSAKICGTKFADVITVPKVDLEGHDALRATEDAPVAEADESVKGVLTLLHNNNARDAKLVVKACEKSGWTRKIDFGPDYGKVLVDGVSLTARELPVPVDSDQPWSFKVTQKTQWNPTDRMTIELKVTDGPNPGAYLLGSDVLDLVGMKIILHPKYADFDPDAKGRVMISALYGTPYHTAAKTTKADGVAQIADREIRITAHAIPASAYAGQTLHFRVLTPDPADPSPYVSVKVGGDNHDLVIGAGKVSAASDAIVPTIINGVEVGAAEVVLKITDRYAGDNYIVQCSLNAGFTPISDETDLLTAWKRMYAEVDYMFRYGVDCVDGKSAGGAAGVGAENDKAYVADAGSLAVDDSVQVISCASATHNTGEVRKIKDINRVSSPVTITFYAPLANTYLAADHAHLGSVKTQANGRYLYDDEYSRDNTAKAFARGFIEILFSPEGCNVVPYKEKISFKIWPNDKDAILDECRDFSQPWFANRAHRDDDECAYAPKRSAKDTGKPNYIHIVYVSQVFYGARGFSPFQHNVIYLEPPIHFGSIGVETLAHELGHQFDAWHEYKGPSGQGPVSNHAHNHDYGKVDCLMNQNSGTYNACSNHLLLGWPADNWPSWRDMPDGR